MALSRQFRALGRISGFFAAVFGAVGVVTGALTVGLVPSTVLLYATAFGALGGISGAVTALLVARSETGRSIEDMPTWRMTFWGLLGGAAPAAFFALLGLIFEGSPEVLQPLLGLGVLGGGLGGVISGSAAAAAKKGTLEPGEPEDLLPGN